MIGLRVAPDNAGKGLAPLERWLAALFLATFAVVGYGVHHLFPFYAFDMFTRGDSTHSERLAAQLPDGSLREVKRLTHWHCPTLPPVGLVPLPPDSPPRCQVRDIMDSQERRALGVLRQRAAGSPAGMPVQVVRRVWRMPSERDAGEVFVCPLLRCTADLVAGER